MNKTLISFCTGCGLCKSLGKATIIQDNKGFYHPIEGDEIFLKKVCPSYGIQTIDMDKNEIWGKTQGVYYGWAEDETLREKGSSGGITTSMCWYLLNEGLIEAVIHTCAKPNDPTKTITCISTTFDELTSRCGSRYAISSPLDIIGQLDEHKRYAFVGKPCDVDALRNYFKINHGLESVIPYLFSFFCMGLPSDAAQNKLLSALGCPKEECEYLSYRGNGWPGLTRAIDTKGVEYTTDYDSSWGNILGRDLMTMCRFCINGVGETADISSGDAWYLDIDKKPVFNEEKGRNVVFARTKKGLEILEGAKKKGYVHLELFEKYREELPLIQYAQYERRGSIGARVNAMRIIFKPHPRYSIKLMNAYKKNLVLSKRFNYFKGTIKRAIKLSMGDITFYAKNSK